MELIIGKIFKEYMSTPEGREEFWRYANKPLKPLVPIDWSKISFEWNKKMIEDMKKIK